MLVLSSFLYSFFFFEGIFFEFFVDNVDRNLEFQISFYLCLVSLCLNLQACMLCVRVRVHMCAHLVY